MMVSAPPTRAQTVLETPQQINDRIRALFFDGAPGSA